MLIIEKPGKHEIVVFAQFALIQFMTLNIGPKKEIETVSKFHVSNPSLLYSIDQSTGECKLLESDGSFRKVKIDDAMSKNPEIDQTYLLPLNDENAEILDNLFDKCGEHSFQFKEAVLPVISKLQYFNIKKYMY